MAGPIDEILADSRIIAAKELRAKHAARARAAQVRYAKYSRLFVLATALAALAGALILYGAGADATGAAGSGQLVDVAVPDASNEALEAATLAPTSEKLATFLSNAVVRTVLFVLQVASLALAAFSAEMLRETRVGLEWFNERRAAEAGRIEIFDKIWSIAKTKGIEAQGAAFDYFVAEQLNKQIEFHEKAEQRHAAGAGRSAVVGATIAALIAATGAIGVGGSVWIALAALVGVLSPVLLNALRGWRESTLDREKSERYRKAWVDLTRLSGETSEASAALASGDPRKAEDLIAKVHDVMRAEHEGWTPTTAKP